MNAGAFVQAAIEVEEALSKGMLVVRVGVNYAVGVCGMGRSRREGDERYGGIEEGEMTHSA
jgi:hypothetical protein